MVTAQAELRQGGTDNNRHTVTPQTDTDIYVIVYSVWRWSLHKQSSGREATDSNRHSHPTDRHRHICRAGHIALVN